jgi:hypothetical protein
LVYLLADYSENAGVAAMIINFPLQLASVAQTTALMTTVKWAMVGMCILAVVAGALVALARSAARQRGDTA